MLTPLTRSVLVGLDEAVVVAMGAPFGVETCSVAAVEPEVLIVVAEDVPLETVRTTAGDVWTEAGLVRGG